MDNEFQDLQRLLRLKRHEAPPSDYFEDFLFEFQRRQRAEMLKRPLWRLALDRLEGARPNFSLPRYAYASASVMAVMAAGVISSRVVTTPATLAAAPVAIAPIAPAHGGLKIVSASPKFDFYTTKHTIRLPEMDFDHPRPAAVSYAQNSRPRYVLDTQPVSYVQPSSF